MSLIHNTLNARNGMADYVTSLIDAAASNGVLRIMQGTQSSPGPEIIALTLQPVSFAPAVSGSASMNVAGVTDIVSTPGDAGHFRMEDGNANLIYTGSVGVVGSGADLEFNTTSFANGAEISLSSFTYTTST